MITLSLSEKEVELLKKLITIGLENCIQSGLSNDCSDYKTLEKIIHRLPDMPLVSNKEVDFKETILEY